jgi:hypothetical protein
LAKEPRLDHLGVVEHQQVAGLKQLWQFAKAAVPRLGAAAIEQL